MENVSLGELVLRLGQARVARALGVKPASIAKAIRTRRQIFVTVAEDGSCTARETRLFPAGGNTAACGVGVSTSAPMSLHAQIKKPSSE